MTRSTSIQDFLLVLTKRGQQAGPRWDFARKKILAQFQILQVAQIDNLRWDGTRNHVCFYVELFQIEKFADCGRDSSNNLVLVQQQHLCIDHDFVR